MSEKLKRCSCCKTELPISEFKKRKVSKDGYRGECKICLSRKDKVYHLANSDERRLYRAAYYLQNKEKLNAQNSVYRKANPGKIRIHEATSRLKNKEKIRIQRAAHYLRNKERIKTKSSAYNKANPEKRKAIGQRRTASLRTGVIENFEDREIFERDRWVCGLCGKHVDETLKHPHPRSKQLDHILPLSRGGDHTKANVQLAHAECNQKKSNKSGSQLRLFG